MRIYAELPWGLDAEGWRRRYLVGLVPDETPYGLHLLAREPRGGVVFRAPVKPRGPLWWFAARSQGRMAGYEFVPAVHARVVEAAARRADIVLSMDERTGVPAALLPTSAAVVSGIAWLESRRDVPAWLLPTVRRALRRMDAIFVECRAMIEPLVTDFAVSPDRIHFVRLGIDSEHFQPAPMPSGPPMVFSVGDDRMRDYPTLISAIGIAERDHPEMTFELATTLPVVLDDGTGVVHRRRMDEAVRECYARSSVVAVALHPTRQGSGLTVILEAMASGRPLVVTDNPGLSDYIVDGVTGYLVPAGDSQAMAHAIGRLVADTALAARMGAAGRRRVEENFTTRCMIDDLQGVLAAALAQPVRGRRASWHPRGPRGTKRGLETRCR